MADFKSSENLKKLLEARQRLKEEELIKRHSGKVAEYAEDLARPASRTSKAVGEGFKLVGKAKDISEAIPGRLVGEFMPPAVSSARDVISVGGSAAKEAVGEFMPPAVSSARNVAAIAKPAAKILGKAAARALAVGTGIGAVVTELATVEDLNKGDPSNAYEKKRARIETPGEQRILASRTDKLAERTADGLQAVDELRPQPTVAPPPQGQPTIEAANALSKSPESRKAIISNFKQLSGTKLTAEQEKMADAYLANPERLAAQQEKEKPGLPAAFTTALLGFLPLIVGAAFGGAEGGAAGGQIGLAAIKQVADEKEAERKAGIEEREQKLKESKERGENVRFDIEQAYKERKLGADIAYQRGSLALQAGELQLKRMQETGRLAETRGKLSSEEQKAEKLGAQAEVQLTMYEQSLKNNEKNYFNSDSFLGAMGVTMARIVPADLEQIAIPDNMQAEIDSGEGFAVAVLRDETGAAMPLYEIQQKKKVFLNRYGDTADQKMQKSIARFMAVAALKNQGRRGFAPGDLERVVEQSKVLATVAKKELAGVPREAAIKELSEDQKRLYLQLKLQGAK